MNKLKSFVSILKRSLVKIVPDFFKEKVKKILKKSRFNKFRASTTHYSEADLVAGLKKMGIVAGDVLLVHSSLKNVGYVEGGAQAVINALLKAVGEEGTLVFPTFTIKGSMIQTLSDSNYIFDPELSPSTVGQISETFRKMPTVCRSIHPTHSLAAIGKHAAYIVENHHLQNTNFGKGTPFGKILELNGKILALGLGFGPITFFHVFEDLNLSLFPEVYLPDSIKVKVKIDGRIQEKEISCHNPEFHKTRIEKDPLVECFFRTYLTEQKIAHWGTVGASASWYMSTQELMHALEVLYKKGKTIYKI